jgi:hypothetical protein
MPYATVNAEIPPVAHMGKDIATADALTHPASRVG